VLTPRGFTSLPTQEEEYSFSGFIPTNKKTNNEIECVSTTRTYTILTNMQNELRECLWARPFWVSVYLHTTCKRSWCNQRASSVQQNTPKKKKSTRVPAPTWNYHAALLNSRFILLVGGHFSSYQIVHGSPPPPFFHANCLQFWCLWHKTDLSVNA